MRLLRVSAKIVRSREVVKPDFSQGRRHMCSQPCGCSRRRDRNRSQKANARSKSGQGHEGHQVPLLAALERAKRSLVLQGFVPGAARRARRHVEPLLYY